MSCVKYSLLQVFDFTSPLFHRGTNKASAERFGCWLCVFVLFLFCATSASAVDSGSCNVQGYVLGENETPMRAVRVRLRSQSHLPGLWYASTDERGYYRFSSLLPGTYELSIARQSNEKTVIQKIELRIGQTIENITELDASDQNDSGELHQTASTETGTLVSPDTTQSSTVSTWNRARIERLPSDREPLSIAAWSNGVVSSRVAPGQLSILGGQPFSNAYYLDGIRISEPFRNGWQNQFNFDVLEEISIMSGGVDAQYGGFSGGVVQMRTIDVKDTFSLDASIYGAPSELRLENPNDTIRTGDTRFYVQTHGPIVRRKLRFLLSASYEDQETEKKLEIPFFIQPDTSEVQVGKIPTKRFRRLSMLAKLIWQPLAWQRFTLWMHGDPSWTNNALQDRAVHPDAERQRYQGGILIAGSADTQLTSNLHLQTRISYNFHRNEVTPASNDLQTPSHFNVLNDSVTVNDYMHIDDRLYQLQMESSAQLDVPDLWGIHQVKLGVDGDIKWQSYFHGLVGGQRFIDSGISYGTSSIDGIGDPYQVEILVSPADLKTWSQRLGVFLQDVWKPSRTFTLRPGIRFDSARAFRDVDVGGDAAYTFNYLSPRIGFSWDPFGDQKSVVRGGYFQYMETGMLLLTQAGGNVPVVDTYQYNPATLQYDAFAQRRGGDASPAIRSATAPPVTHEWMLGFERQLSKETTFSVVGIYRRSANLFEDEETNIQWSADGSVATGFQNGTPNAQFAYGTTAEAFRRYTALQLSLDKALSDGWQMWAVYTLSRLMGTSDSPLSYAFNNPRQRQYEYGWLTDDVTQSARLGVSYEFPLGIQLGAVATYLSGAPYDQLYFNEYFSAYQDRRAPRGCDPTQGWSRAEDCAQLRLPDSFTLDVRLLWSLKKLTTQDISLVVDIFNAFHTRSILELEQRMLQGETKTFGETLKTTEPLRGRMGLRVRF